MGAILNQFRENNPKASIVFKQRKLSFRRTFVVQLVVVAFFVVIVLIVTNFLRFSLGPAQVPCQSLTKDQAIPYQAFVVVAVFIVIIFINEPVVFVVDFSIVVFIVVCYCCLE